MPSPDFDTLQIGGIVISAKGGKTAPITQSDSGWAHWDPKETLQVVMEPGAYQDAAATRVNLMLRPNAAQQAELEELDKWVLAYATKNSERFFGKALSATQVKERYLPCLKASDKYPPTLRVKMNLEGIGKTLLDTGRRGNGGTQELGGLHNPGHHSPKGPLADALPVRDHHGTDRRSCLRASEGMSLQVARSSVQFFVLCLRNVNQFGSETIIWSVSFSSRQSSVQCLGGQAWRRTISHAPAANPNQEASTAQ